MTRHGLASTFAQATSPGATVRLTPKPDLGSGRRQTIETTSSWRRRISQQCGLSASTIPAAEAALVSRKTGQNPKKP